MHINEYKKYLEPEFIARFSNLEVTTKMILQGFMLGLHNSPLHGFSAEFLEHLQHHTKTVRTLLAPRVKNQLRIIPEIAFVIDDSMDYVNRIEELLKK